ncbi:MAG: hypothetical protein LBM98_01665 [Oscillospiraceae bacterium]|nr:hypothetical protein [Oscillospiraceae bacterium]
MNNYEGRTRRILRQPWIASPHFIGTYRECGGGFAKTVRALPCPVPALCAGTLDVGCVALGAGNHPAACGRHPSTEGIKTGTNPPVSLQNPATHVCAPYPLCGGVAPQSRGGFPATADATTSKPSSLISDIC